MQQVDNKFLSEQVNGDNAAHDTAWKWHIPHSNTSKLTTQHFLTVGISVKSLALEQDQSANSCSPTI